MKRNGEQTVCPTAFGFEFQTRKRTNHQESRGAPHESAIVRRAFLGVGLSVVIAACGCNPKLETLRVYPQGYCKNTRAITVALRGKGDVYLKVSPTDQDYRKVNANDSEPITPPRHAFVEARVNRHNRQDGGGPIEVFPISDGTGDYDMHPLYDDVGSCVGGWAATPAQTFTSDYYDPAVRIGAIRNDCKQTSADDPCPAIRIQHGDKSWDLQPGERKVVDVQPVGTWQVMRRLAPGEKCVPPPEAGEKSAGGSATAESNQYHLTANLELTCGAEGVSQ